MSKRPIIYQLFVRTFGNTNETNRTNGSMEENGCGKFADVSLAALKSLKKMGFTHLWLTGVLEQASATSYACRPADDVNLVKGKAGSPYAIRDYFDVCPDYAIEPASRMGEFRALLDRCKRCEIAVIIDFVPNHVARSYASDVRPEWSFGNGDDVTKFFDRDNHFYYFPQDAAGGGPPLKLPTAHLPGCDGSYAEESEWGRVTGNNVISWAPSIHDWYETVKLNYGHDFTTGRNTAHLPAGDAGVDVVPKTWRMMDEIIGYWQSMGVSGFRADMAHMIPMEFWRWMIKRARGRQQGVFFMAEAYDNDPAKLTDGPVLEALLEAGFDAVYDDPSYDVLMGLYDGVNWSNDLDGLIFTGERFHRSLRYGENHDEVRLATPLEWGATGMKVGKPVCAALFALGRGPVMMYNGQEVGEPAAGVEGFGGDDGRTSIFDYWCMPELAKWVNGHRYDGGRLSPEQKELRAWYGKLLTTLESPAFVDGEFYGLNFANRGNVDFGRCEGETVSGHWLYAFLRQEKNLGEAFLCVVHFHPHRSAEQVRILIPEDAQHWLGIGQRVCFAEVLEGEIRIETRKENLASQGIVIPMMSNCSAMYFRISH